MKNIPQQLTPLRTSFVLLALVATFTAGLIACSDIEDGGITQTEVEQAQSQAYTIPEGDEPLYIANGEPLSKDEMSRLKPKYIQSINVLKGQKAQDKYGDAGKNGVVDITLIDKEMALANLLDEPPAARSSSASNNEEEVYMAVEEQPKMQISMQELQQRITYPDRCKRAGIEGRVTVQFIVNTNGEAENFEVIRGIGGGCDEAAVEAVKGVRFTPGKQRGEKVNVQMSLPIVFKI